MPDKSSRELLAERARIDAAMAQLEAAKLKASAQRAEYGRFLSWKVELQRKERKQREEETHQLRERVEKKLTEVLKEHREHKKKEAMSYREFVVSKVPKVRALNIAASSEREQEILVEAQAEKERRRMEWERFRSEMGLRSAPSRTNLNNASSNKGDAVRAAVTIQKTLNQSVAPFVDASPHAPAPVSAPSSPNQNQYGEEEYDAVLLRDKVGHVGGLVKAIRQDNEGVEEQYNALKQSRLMSLSHTEKKQKHVHQRAEMMEAMFHKARTRRLYAQSRIASDPPADYLIGTDILRYIPVDLIPGGAQFGEVAMESPRKRGQLASDGNAFFMTAVDSSHADNAPPELSVMHPAPPEGGSPSSSPRADQTTNKRKSRLKNFDPHQWTSGKLLKGPIPELKQERVPEEEEAMYSWYKAQEEQSSRPAKWKSRSYAWNRREEIQRQQQMQQNGSLTGVSPPQQRRHHGEEPTTTDPSL